MHDPSVLHVVHALHVEFAASSMEFVILSFSMDSIHGTALRVNVEFAASSMEFITWNLSMDFEHGTA